MSVESLKEDIGNLGQEQWKALLSWVVMDERSRRDSAEALEKERVATAKAIWEAKPDLKPDFVPADGDLPEPERETKTALVEVYPTYKTPANPWEVYPLGAMVSNKREVYRKDRVNTAKREIPPSEEGSGWTAITEDILETRRQEKLQAQVEADAEEEE